MKINLRYVRYVVFFLAFFILTFAVQVFVQNFTINKTIKDLKITQENLSWSTLWMKTYYKSFLTSKYATYFFKHRQWITSSGEMLVKINNINDSEKAEKSIDKNGQKNYNQTTKKSWDDFFYRLKLLFSND